MKANKNYSSKDLLKQLQYFKKLSYFDELTGILNRRGFLEYSQKFFEEAKNYQKFPNRRKNLIIKSLSLVIFDIDHFKKINDEFGHQIGDKILKEAVKIIKNEIRQIDVFARWGGDEFVICLVGAKEKDAVTIMNNLKEKIEKTEFKANNQLIKITLSVGVAGLNKEDNFNELFKKADKALYQAKQNGRNKVVLYSA